jgi:hypothetical protein
LAGIGGVAVSVSGEMLRSSSEEEEDSTATAADEASEDSGSTDDELGCSEAADEASDEMASDDDASDEALVSAELVSDDGPIDVMSGADERASSLDDVASLDALATV